MNPERGRSRLFVELGHKPRFNIAAEGDIKYVRHTTTRISRSQREFLPSAARVVLASLAILGTGALSAYFWDTYLKEDGYSRLDGGEVEGRANVLKVTDPLDASDPWIPVRKKLSRNDDDIIGWVKPGLRINTTEVRGPSYPSRYAGVGWYADEGGVYGRWFFTSDGMPAYKRQKDGSYVPMMRDGKQLEVSGFVSGNYVRPPAEKELQKSTPAK